MTIDKLFNMPICEMSEWLTDNYRDPKGYYKKDYWFTDIKECFGVEFPEGCGWRIIPCMSTYRDKDTSPLEKIKEKYYDTLEFAVAKVSKYGECLVYTLSGRFTYNDVKKKYANGKKVMGFDYYIDRQYSFELEKITCEDTTNNKCRVYIDGPDVVNNSDLAVHFQLSESGDYHNKWLDQYEFIDKFYSIGFNGKPIISSPHKNKHSLNEFADKLEKFAKKVNEHAVKAYNDNKTIINDSEFIKKCKSVHLKPEEIYDVWVALYVENQNVTLDDVIGMMRLSESTETFIEEYVDKCKCQHITKDWDNKYSITSHPYYNCYHVCLLYGKKGYTMTENFMGYVKDLNKTREMYKAIDGYKDIIKNAKADYKDSYKLMAQTFENKLLDVYEEIREKLEAIKDGYLEKSKEIYKEIHEKYPGVNDIDVGIFEDEVEIIDNIHKSFERTAPILMKKIDPKHKLNIIKKSNKSNKNKNDDKEFLDHCKKLFDAAPGLEKIIYYSVHKAYDAPYEVYESDDIDGYIDEDSIYDYEEKYGQGSFNEWFDKFEILRPSGPSDYRSFGSDLYPGCEYNLFVNRNLEFSEGEEYTG